MELFNLACDLLVPLIMIGFGWRFMKKPPKDINGSYGYRTPASMRNQDTWDFAHRTCGRIWLAAELVMLPLSVLAWVRTLPCPVGDAGMLTAGIGILETAVLLLTIVPVEWALKRNFDKNGVRRQA